MVAQQAIQDPGTGDSERYSYFNYEYRTEVEGHPEFISGEVVGEQIELRLEGDDWKMEIHLRQEGSLMKRWQRLADATDF